MSKITIPQQIGKQQDGEIAGAEMKSVRGCTGEVCRCLAEFVLLSEKAVWGETADGGNYCCTWNGQHRHLRELTDSLDFWVIITHRNAGHVRLWSPERCHVAFKLPYHAHVLLPANEVPKTFVLQPFKLHAFAIFSLTKWHGVYEVCNSRCCMHTTLRKHNTRPTACFMSTVRAPDGAGKSSNCAPQGVAVGDNTTTNPSVHFPGRSVLSPASPDFNYLPSGMWGIQWRERLLSTSPVSCARFIFLVSHFQD